MPIPDEVIEAASQFKYQLETHGLQEWGDLHIDLTDFLNRSVEEYAGEYKRQGAGSLLSALIPVLARMEAFVDSNDDSDQGPFFTPREQALISVILNRTFEAPPPDETPGDDETDYGILTQVQLMRMQQIKDGLSILAPDAERHTRRMYLLDAVTEMKPLYREIQRLRDEALTVPIPNQTYGEVKAHVAAAEWLWNDTVRQLFAP
jgi:hypothetical protein